MLRPEVVLVWSRLDNILEQDDSHFAGQQSESENPSLATEINPKFSWLHDLEVEGQDEDKLCLNCPKWIPANYPLDLAALWLHAMEYSCASWSFRCPSPEWSNVKWDPSEFEMKSEETLVQTTDAAWLNDGNLQPILLLNRKSGLHGFCKADCILRPRSDFAMWHYTGLLYNLASKK